MRGRPNHGVVTAQQLRIAEESLRCVCSKLIRAAEMLEADNIDGARMPASTAFSIYLPSLDSFAETALKRCLASVRDKKLGVADRVLSNAERQRRYRAKKKAQGSKESNDGSSE